MSVGPITVVGLSHLGRTDTAGILDSRICWRYTPLVPEFPDELAGCVGFQWDAGNSGKNRKRHGVIESEAEQLFFNRPVLVAPAKSTGDELRYAALGQTTQGRFLTVVFTIRETLVRVISARDMSRRERKIYERPKKDN